MTESHAEAPMNGLKARLQSDLTLAMKARDAVRAGTIRMALTAIRSDEVAGSSARQLSEPEVITVLGREAKKRREAAAAFDGAGRTELASRERAELAVLQDYLPGQLDDDELSAVIREEIDLAAAPGSKAGMALMGPVMKSVTARVAGRADGTRTAAEVRRQLTG